MHSSRRLLVGGVSTVKGRVRGAGPAIVAICDSIEPVLMNSGWFTLVPFTTISIILRFAEQASSDVDIETVDAQHKELPVAVTLAMSDVDRKTSEQLVPLFRQSVVQALRAVSQKFGLPQLPFA
jgi:hypothetical protein